MELHTSYRFNKHIMRRHRFSATALALSPHVTALTHLLRFFPGADWRTLENSRAGTG